MCRNWRTIHEKKKKRKNSGRGDVVLLVQSAEINGTVTEGVYHDGRQFLEQNGFHSVHVPKGFDNAEKQGHVKGLAPQELRKFVVVEYHENHSGETYMPFNVFLVTPTSKKLIESGKVATPPIVCNGKEELWLIGNKENWEVTAVGIPESMFAHLARFSEDNADIKHIETGEFDSLELTDPEEREDKNGKAKGNVVRQIAKERTYTIAEIAVTPETVKKFSTVRATGQLNDFGLKFVKPSEETVLPLTWAQQLCRRNQRIGQFVTSHCSGSCTIMALSNAIKALADGGMPKTHIADMLGETDFSVSLILDMQNLHSELQPLLELREGAMSSSVASALCKINASIQPKVWNLAKGYDSKGDMIKKIEQFRQFNQYLK